MNAVSFVTPIPMPATLIFGLFYQPPDGHADGLHLGFSLLLWIPVINAVLMLLLSPALLKFSRRTVSP
ncbi:MAG: hypothetical protein Q4C67_06355 [Deinococcus sp.]|nr:hypothetical protein [Deinococcus sp.]